MRVRLEALFVSALVASAGTPTTNAQDAPRPVLAGDRDSARYDFEMARKLASTAFTRLWAEEAISRIYQRFFDTAQRLHYFPTGDGRLTHQRNTNPQTDEEPMSAGFTGVAFVRETTFQ